jgi:2-methylcitrate dehydratase PrpD
MDTPAAARPHTATLATFAVETKSADIPPAAIEAAKRVILDTVGVALAASSRHIGHVITDHAAANPGSPATATILGSGGKKVSPPMAALANGTLANALDYDEGGHLATHVLPAALATAEHHNHSGRELVEAFIVGFECGSRLTQVIDFKRRQNGGPTHRGWWHVGLVGPIAAAFAVGRLRGLNRAEMATAVGIATCGGGGFRRNMGTMAKALHSGNAARDGIQAVDLAKLGFTSDPQILEAPLGFIAAICPSEDDRNEAAVLEKLGKPYMLEGPQRIKKYPVCNPAHPIIDAALRLHDQKSFTVDQIEAVDADLHTFSLLRPEPWDEESAGFSGAYAIAVALIHGQVGLDQVTDAVVHDAGVKALMAKIRHNPQKQNETVTVRLKGGKAVAVDVHEVKRHTTAEGISAKFRDAAGRALPAANVEPLETLIGRLDKEANVRRLMELAGSKA